jgi:hypothetical protein
VEEGSRQFLPPQPAGPEPELGARPASPPPPPPSYSPPAGAAPPQYQQALGYAQQPAQPDNGPAVAGFVLSLVSLGLLLFTFGLSSLISASCAILGIVFSRKGKKKVQAGETTKNAGIAQAGFIISIVSLCLSVIATAAWAAVLVDDDARRDLEREFDNSETIRAVVRVAVALLT